MEAIFTSKLYKASQRKNKIHSAIQDPVNVELVQQLREYLDEPEVDETKVVEPEISEPEVDEEEFVDTEEKTIEEVAEEHSSTSSPSVISNPTITKTEDKEESLESEDSVEDVPENTQDSTRTFHSPAKEVKKNEEDSTSSESVEESVQVNAIQINSATVLYPQPVESCCCPCDYVDVEAVRGTLNIRDDTKGVSRIFIKEDELWIYYQDKVNLNSVMEPVIEVLNSTGFTNLEFNRLARTENAIVFEISCVFQPVQSIKNEE